MSVFLAFVLVLVLVIAAKKRWLPLPSWLPKLLAKKNEATVNNASLEIVVDRESSSSQAPSRLGGDKAPVARKSLFVKPPRHEGPAHASSGSMETSIRSALNELRSRQVVKSLCSKFEARVARHSITSSADDDEESCIRAANGGDDEYLLPEQSQTLRREEPRAVPAPFVHRRGSNSGNAAKPNNLNAFLRRYSSNLERANAATELEAPSPITFAEPTMTTTTSLKAVAITPATLVPPTAAPVQAHAFVPRAVIAEIESLDIQLSLVGDNEETSNQCDSPVRAEPLPLPFLGSSADEPAGNDSDDDGGCLLNGGDHASDWDVTRASKCPQSPEQGSHEDKAAFPAVPNSVARFRQFQLQIPPNYARSAAGSAQ